MVVELKQLCFGSLAILYGPIKSNKIKKYKITLKNHQPGVVIKRKPIIAPALISKQLTAYSGQLLTCAGKHKFAIKDIKKT